MEEKTSAAVIDFGDEQKVTCSAVFCKAGHNWIPTLRAANCPGCSTPMLLLKMINCPYCNEPAIKLNVRLDHLAQGGQLTPVCRGSASHAEVIRLDIQLNAALEEESRYIEREVLSKI